MAEASIGISDLLAYRECPRRMSYGMRRHTGPGEQSDQRTPEAGATTRYGSAVHDLIALTEDGWSDEDALARTWQSWGSALDPDDLELLKYDLAVYRTRDMPNTRTVLAEDEIRVPLTLEDGRSVFFRARIDRLYERLDAPGHFILVDYKSSKWAKSEAAVHTDPQLSAYDLALRLYFPEIEDLLVVYDQLRYGQIPTRRSETQRAAFGPWLLTQIQTVLDDDRVQDDGLLPYRFNEWCPWCPILESCGVVDDLTDYALTRIATLAPAEKVGRRVITRVEPERVEEYAEEFERVKAAQKVLTRFEDAVRDLLRDAPAEKRSALGYALRQRRNSVFDLRAKRALAERLGVKFYEAVGVTKTALEQALADDPELLAWALEQATEVAGNPTLARSPDRR